MKALGAVVFGAVAFWGPDILVHATAGSAFAGAAVLVITVVMPVTTLLAFMRLECAPSRGVRPWLTPWLMLLGIWMFGPACMMVSASLSGGGLFTLGTSGGWGMLMDMTLHFVPYAFMMATYDGALAALLVATLLLPLAPLLRNRTGDGDSSERAA